MDDLARRTEMLEVLDQACDRFESEFRAGRSPRIEDVLSAVSAVERANWRRCLLEIELEIRVQRGDDLQLDEYFSRFPDAPEAVYSAFAAVCPRALNLSSD